jgi:hypothetical protein
MTTNASVFQRELDDLEEGNARAETKKEMNRLSQVCKGQSDELITRKLRKLLGSRLQGDDLARMVAALQSGEKIDVH